MAYIKINNVAIRGISACAPAKIEENTDLPVFELGEAERVINQTGIARKHVVEPGTTSLDLCKRAMEKLLEDLKWEKETIDVLIFVSTTFDHIIPPNACILQGMLGLSEETLCMDLRQGCPGWTHGMTTMSSLLSNGSVKRGIMLVGDTPSLSHSPLNKETRPLFGDAGTATALEFDTSAAPIEFYHGTRGKDYKSIYAKNGGFRYPTDEEALKFVEYETNIKYRGIDVVMDGMSVFGFGLSMSRAVKGTYIFPLMLGTFSAHFGGGCSGPQVLRTRGYTIFGTFSAANTFFQLISAVRRHCHTTCGQGAESAANTFFQLDLCRETTLWHNMWTGR